MQAPHLVQSSYQNTRWNRFCNTPKYGLFSHQITFHLGHKKKIPIPQHDDPPVAKRRLWLAPNPLPSGRSVDAPQWGWYSKTAFVFLPNLRSLGIWRHHDYRKILPECACLFHNVETMGIPESVAPLFIKRNHFWITGVCCLSRVRLHTRSAFRN